MYRLVAGTENIACLSESFRLSSHLYASEVCVTDSGSWGAKFSPNPFITVCFLKTIFSLSFYRRDQGRIFLITGISMIITQSRSLDAYVFFPPNFVFNLFTFFTFSLRCLCKTIQGWTRGDGRLLGKVITVDKWNHNQSFTPNFNFPSY